MINATERETALNEMRRAANAFYHSAVHIGVHPFIEFAGLMNEYIGACENAHAKGIDFSECNTHSGQALPLEAFQRQYLAEKIECIFHGSIELRVEGATKGNQHV